MPDTEPTPPQPAQQQPTPPPSASEQPAPPEPVQIQMTTKPANVIADLTLGEGKPEITKIISLEERAKK